MPIRQGSSRPVVAVRDCVYTHAQGSSLHYAPALQMQSGRDGERENYLLLPLYLLANSIDTPLHLLPLLTVQQCYNSSGLLAQSHGQQTTHIYSFSCGGRGDYPLHCTPTEAHCALLNQATSASLQGMHKHTGTGWQQKHMQSHPHFHLSPPVSSCHKQTNSGREIKICIFWAELFFLSIPTPSCSQRRRESFIRPHDWFTLSSLFFSGSWKTQDVYSVQSPNLWAAPPQSLKMFSVSTQVLLLSTRPPCNELRFDSGGW